MTQKWRNLLGYAALTVFVLPLAALIVRFILCPPVAGGPDFAVPKSVTVVRGKTASISWSLISDCTWPYRPVKDEMSFGNVRYIVRFAEGPPVEGQLAVSCVRETRTKADYQSEDFLVPENAEEIEFHVPYTWTNLGDLMQHTISADISK